MKSDKQWLVNTGDISVTKLNAWRRFLNRLRFRHDKNYDYVVRVAIYPFGDPYNKQTVWYTPKKQYSNHEKVSFVYMLTQLPGSMGIEDLIYVLVNSIRPNTFNESNFTDLVDLHTSPYYKKLSPM